MIEHISNLLNNLDIQYVFEEEIIIIPYEDNDYISPNGTSNYIIFIFENPTEVLNLVLPEIFFVNEDIPEMFHRLMELYTNQKVLIKHRVSGESNVDMYIQIPLLNQKCSEEQLEFAIHTLTTSVTELYKAIQHLDEKGEIDLDFLHADEVSEDKEEIIEDDESQNAELTELDVLLSKEEIKMMTNAGCTISLFDAILLSENVQSFQQLTPFVDPSLSFRDLKRDSEGIPLFMQLVPLFNTVNLEKLFHHMKDKMNELDSSIAKKLSEEAKTRFADVMTTAKENGIDNPPIETRQNDPSNNTSTDNDESTQKINSGSEDEQKEERKETEANIQTKEKKKDRPNFDIL